jgi:hypothetical protein
MEPLSLQVGEKSNRRRSQRVLLSVPVSITVQAPDKPPLTEDTHTMVVNAHGALLLFKLKVAIGQMLTLKNNKTQEEISCRVVFAHQNPTGKSEVGVEFLKPAPAFWRIAFPPTDWTPKSPDAKGFTAKPGEKLAPAPKK